MKKWWNVLLSCMLALMLAGCGGPQKVNDKQMTLDLSYGKRVGTYTGEINDQGLPNGQGKFTSKNPQGIVWYHEGTFKNGHFEGKGKTVWPNNGIEKSGTFKDDNLNGQGKLTNKYHPENSYEGNFEGGLPALETVPMNTEVTYADWAYKVTGVALQNSAGNLQSKGKYLVVTIDATNNGQQTRQPGSNHFFCVYDKTNGFVYQMDDRANLALRMNKLGGDWYLSHVNPGLTATAIQLVYDIPKDLDVSHLKFIASQGFGKVAPIQLQLQS